MPTLAAQRVAHESPPRIVLADLRRSGLTPKDAVTLRVEYFDPEDVRALVEPSSRFGHTATEFPPAYKLPYFSQENRINGFYRLRFLGEYTPPRDKKSKPQKPQRYWQSSGSTNHLYFPPLIKWSKIAKDPNTTIYICEGEKKAAALCKLGHAALGIGGAWNWASDSELIDDFRQIKWGGRRVELVPDSDVSFKLNVRQGFEALGQHLIQAGATPSLVELPELRGHDKAGVDDFIVHHGRGAAKAFEQLPRRSLLVPASGLNALELSKKNFPAPRWAVPGLFPVGLTVFAGPPKIGKSWFMLDVTLCGATGAIAVGHYRTEAAETLYLALEDTPRRLQARLRIITHARKIQPTPRAHFFNEWPRVEEHGLTALERWLDAHPGCKLVCIDTLARMRQAPKAGGHLYFDDYESVTALKKIADMRDIAIVAVHHLRKSEDDDPLYMISGSAGISGGADTLIILRRARNQADATLYINGRDIGESELALKFVGGVWSVLGDASEFRMTAERRQIISAFEKLGRSATPSEIAVLIGKKRGTVQKLMLTMGNDGLLRWNPGGKYELSACQSIKRVSNEKY